MVTDDNLVDKLAVGQDRTARTLDPFRLDGVGCSGDRISLERRCQRFGHHVPAVGIDRSGHFRVGDEADLDGVVDLVPGLLSRILDPAHEVSRQSLLDQRRR
jgi:hypothetical protein